MSSYTLTYRPGRSPALIDGSALRPDLLCPLSAKAVAATLLPIGRSQVPLGDLFTIAESCEGQALRLRDLPPLDKLGANMQHGELIIEGDAGDDLGASMSGGLIHVLGGAGHRVGGPAVTSKRGMTGGEILIDENAGDFAGFLMRRGLIAVAGHTGKGPGYRMLAGTIVLAASCGDHPGLEMQRGTIVCLNAVTPGCNFAEAGTFAASALPAMSLVAARLHELGWRGLGGKPNDVQRIASGRFRVWSGDRLTLHKGEVMQWLS